MSSNKYEDKELLSIAIGDLLYTEEELLISHNDFFKYKKENQSD